MFSFLTNLFFGFIKIFFIAFFVGVTFLAGFATYKGIGAQELEHPKGISLRQESVRRGGGLLFFPMYTRTHYGGGFRGGK
jgi:hypothetical protein